LAEGVVLVFGYYTTGLVGGEDGGTKGVLVGVGDDVVLITNIN